MVARLIEEMTLREPRQTRLHVLFFGAKVTSLAAGLPGAVAPAGAAQGDWR